MFKKTRFLSSFFVFYPKNIVFYLKNFTFHIIIHRFKTTLTYELMIKYYPLLYLSALLLMLSCKNDDDSYQQVSPVNFDINTVPYNTLSEYIFFENEDNNLSSLTPVYGVIPYEPTSSLFSDYSKKKRFIWMPDDVNASVDSDYSILDFPTGTILIKTFYYDNVLPTNDTKIIETRLIIKKETEWIFANYVWNEDQTEAYLDMDGSQLAIEFNDGGIIRNANYRIPSEQECKTCHKISNVSTPIGVKPQNLNSNFDYSDGNMNQLDKLVSFGYLNTVNTANINSIIDWTDTSQSLELRARSYLDINCAHCHTDNSHCSYRPIRFSFHQTEDPENIGICVVPDENIDPSISHVIAPGRPERSGMLFRMQSDDEAIRMPLIGRSIIHQEGMQLISDWIDSLDTTCN